MATKKKRKVKVHSCRICTDGSCFFCGIERIERYNRLKRIHVNQHVIRSNKRNGENKPPIGVETAGRKKVYGHNVAIDGPSVLVYRPDKPLKCGARLWIETHSKVTVYED